MADGVQPSSANAVHNKASAPYGQACTNCVKSKCRCMMRSGGTCERCNRLSKECRPSASIRKRNNRKLASASKRSNLEDRLDDLVTLLRMQHTARPSQHGSIESHIPTPGSLALSPQLSSYDRSCDLILTDDELSQFRDLHLPQFPFMYLPSDLTASQLQSEKPVLCMALKTIMNKAHVVQVELSRSVRELIGSKLLVDGEKSLDLLLSVLTCMAWSVYFTGSGQFLGMFSGLARTLVSDLRLDRPCWYPSLGPVVEDTSIRSNEKRRAVLGCFALTTKISTTFKYDGMPWLPQINEDCAKLSAHAETPGDGVLVDIVRICRSSQQVFEISRHVTERPIDAEHIAMHVGPLLASFEQLKSTLSEPQLKNNTVAAYLHGNELLIYELALIQPSALNCNSSSVLHHKRLDYLLMLLHACKTYTNHYIGLNFIYITTPCNLMFTYCLKLLYGLSVLKDPSWDSTAVREAVDLLKLFERCATTAENSNAELKAELAEDSVFAEAAKAIRDIAPKWRVPNQDPQPDDRARPADWSSEHAMNTVPSDGFLDFMDDFWLSTPLNI